LDRSCFDKPVLSRPFSFDKLRTNAYVKSIGISLQERNLCLEEVFEMLPFKKILCAIDFSEPSIEALKVSNELALHFASELLIVHVIPPIPVTGTSEAGPSVVFDLARYQGSLKGHYEGLLADAIDKDVSKGVSQRSMVLYGDVAREIARVAGADHVDLILVAPHSHSGLRRLFFGSLAERITRLAPCPVMSFVPRMLAGEEEEKQPGEGSSLQGRGSLEDKKKAYQEKVELQLKEWGAQIDELKARAEKSKADLKVKYEEQIKDLKSKQEDVKQKLSEIKGYGGEAWEDLRGGVEKALGELKDAIGKAVSRFRKE
jgi:nucleotide-binding universal stress UspA family protein